MCLFKCSNIGILRKDNISIDYLDNLYNNFWKSACLDMSSLIKLTIDGQFI